MYINKKIKNYLKFSSSLRQGKEKIATKNYILELAGEDDSYTVKIINPATHEVELKFRILKEDEEQSFKTLSQYLWLPPRLMEEVLTCEGNRHRRSVHGRA